MNKEKLKKQTWVFLALFAAVMLPNKLWFDNEYLKLAGWGMLCLYIMAEFLCAEGKAAKTITFIFFIMCGALLVWDIYKIIAV